MTLTTGEMGCLLVGMLLGAVLVLGLAGLAWFLVDVRRAVREGTPIEGDGIERARRRGEL